MAGNEGSHRRWQVEFEQAEKERARAIQAEAESRRCECQCWGRFPAGETEAGICVPALLGGRGMSRALGWARLLWDRC